MYNLLADLLKAHYYTDRAEAKEIIDCLFVGKSVTATEYGQLLVLLNAEYPEVVEEEATEPTDGETETDLGETETTEPTTEE